VGFREKTTTSPETGGAAVVTSGAGVVTAVPVAVAEVVEPDPTVAPEPELPGVLVIRASQLRKK
jgi:hypothetical protein